ncbi:MAG: isoprenylcysteine carboxylmethyltransferase family protein [Candidatus Omnitrophica bacterium]|nr:isoprenylcysteine carboxylmethyltransferase family protein [Candidatus Omnitrophota bacterium]
MIKNLRFKKMRLWASYPFAAVYLVFVYKYGIVVNPGLGVIIAGLLIRFWAAGYIKKIRKLTTSGPYAFVRNPLYVGNFLIGLGFCLFVNNIYLSIIYTLLFAFFYLGTMRKEEILLTQLFGNDYIEYKKAVPAFFPRLTPYKSKDPIRFSLAQAHFNGELIRVLVTGGLLCLLYFFYYSFKEKSLDLKDMKYVGLLLIVQVLLLLFTIFHRRKFVKQESAKAA